MSERIDSKAFSEYLYDCGVCDYCVLRYLKPQYEEFWDVRSSLKKRGIKIAPESDESFEKKSKTNPCVICYNVFHEIDELIQKIKNHEGLKKYNQINTFLSSFCLPVLLELTQLQMWLTLLDKFPENFDKERLPDMPIKDAVKTLLNDKLEQELDKTFDPDGLMISIFFNIENENEILSKLDMIAPELMTDRNKQKKKYKTEVISRNYFAKHFQPTNIDIKKFQEHLPLPPSIPSSSLQLTQISFTGPTVFVAGRYNKFSRHLSQSPWFIGEKRMSEGSVQESITCHVAPYFDALPSAVTFMSSGREDVDVRCLGRGRPFALEITDATKTTLDSSTAADIERKVCQSRVVSIRDLQIVKRDDLHHIKSGEEEKRKIYRALCTLRDKNVTEDILTKLDISEPFEIQQWTPIRVLHRRTLIKRPRTIYKVKAFAVKDKPHLVVLDIITQAGTYVKELVHSEFSRTEPSISSIISMDIDIIALDVMNIELNFPPTVVRENA